MPNPQEVATVIANGLRLSTWQTVEVECEFGKPFAYARLTVAEIGSTTGGWNSLKLKPGDPVTVQLAGQQCIDGIVVVRQPGYDAKSHMVEIVIASAPYKANTSTVRAKPGEYIDYTLQQIASAVLGEIGVGFQIIGDAPNADLPFDRVNEHVGETRYSIVERLCRMRNLHLVDDAQGNLLAARGATGGVVAQLVEGKNILRANIAFRIDEFADQVTGIGQHQGSDNLWGDPARDIACSISAPGLPLGVPLSFLAEQPCNQAELQMRTAHEMDWQYLNFIDGIVTTTGWLMDDGSLWIKHVGALVTLNSPMLWPGNPLTLWIKGIRHLQSNEGGTVTEVIVTHTLTAQAVQGIGETTGGPFGAPSQATPDAPDTGAG